MTFEQTASMIEPAPPSLIPQTAMIVSAYVGRQPIAANDIPKLIADVHAALIGLQNPEPVTAPVKQEPAVPVRKSVTPDFLICLEDGKKFKSLRRHLMTHYGLTMDQYREKWGLPADYPAVSPNYSATRSALAKENGLGTKR